MDKGGGKTLIHKKWIICRFFFLEPTPNIINLLKKINHEKDYFARLAGLTTLLNNTENFERKK